MDVTGVAVPVDTRAPGGKTNAYVIGREPAVLVDPADSTDELDVLVRERGVAHVVVTHTHPDHVGGVATYADRHGLTCWALRGHEARYEAATGVEPDVSFVDGARLDLDEGSLRLLALPGHAEDHVGIALPDDGPICSGDCAVRRGSVAVGGPDGDMQAYLDSLRRLDAESPSALLPGHGPPIERPSATIDRLVTHRLRRENRIRRAVERGARTVDEVVDASYEKDLSGVRDLTHATVVAHLEKLAADGVVDWDGERARPVERRP